MSDDKYHDSDWHIEFAPLRFGAWRCKQDGGLAVGLLGVGFCRMHRDDPLDFWIRPFLLRRGGEWKYAKLVFVPSYRT